MNFNKLIEILNKINAYISDSIVFIIYFLSNVYQKYAQSLSLHLNFLMKWKNEKKGKSIYSNRIFMFLFLKFCFFYEKFNFFHTTKHYEDIFCFLKRLNRKYSDQSTYFSINALKNINRMINEYLSALLEVCQKKKCEQF